MDCSGKLPVARPIKSEKAARCVYLQTKKELLGDQCQRAKCQDPRPPTRDLVFPGKKYESGLR